MRYDCLISKLLHMSDRAYEARSRKYLTAEQVVAWSQCPALYRQVRAGLPLHPHNCYRETELLDAAARIRILCGRERLEEEYAINGPTNKRIGLPYGRDSAAFREWAATQTRPALHDDQLVIIEAMAEAVQKHERARNLLSSGVANGVLAVEYEGMPCQVRLDYVHPQEGIVHLVMCQYDLYSAQSETRWYPFQYHAAFMCVLASAVAGTEVPLTLIGILRAAPSQCTMWPLEDPNHYSFAPDARRHVAEMVRRIATGDMTLPECCSEECRVADLV